MSLFLAAIRSASPSPGATAPAGTPGAVPAATPDLIRDIAPPVEYFPFPTWVVVVVALIVVGLLAMVGMTMYQAWKSRPPPLPPSPLRIAMQELARLRDQARTADPYAFSIAVSHVLRRFIEDQYRVPALEQTSPEFLSAITRITSFSKGERVLLGSFLERCDAIKFARVGGDAAVNEALLGSALAFVQGGAA